MSDQNIYFKCFTFILKKHLIDLTYFSDYYKIGIKNCVITMKNFFLRLAEIKT